MKIGWNFPAHGVTEGFLCFGMGDFAIFGRKDLKKHICCFGIRECGIRPFTRHGGLGSSVNS